MRNHIWRENFNLHTGVSNFSNQFSSKNHQKSLIFIEKSSKIIDFHKNSSEIISDVKISIYIPILVHLPPAWWIFKPQILLDFLQDFFRFRVIFAWFCIDLNTNFVFIFSCNCLRQDDFSCFNFCIGTKPEIRARWCNYLRRDDFSCFNFCSNFTEKSSILACFFMQLSPACWFFRRSISARISTKNHRFGCAFWCVLIFSCLVRANCCSGPRVNAGFVRAATAASSTCEREHAPWPRLARIAKSLRGSAPFRDSRSPPVPTDPPPSCMPRQS